jgi:hypothetical protein
MKCLYWILGASILMTMLAYTVVNERRPTCSVPHLSQVLK